MGFRDRLEQGASRLGESARQGVSAASAQWQDDRFDGVRALFAGGEEQALSVEAFMVALVQAVRMDNHGRPTAHDVYLAARKRRRRLAVLALGTGPLVGVVNQLADLYCEAATVCDISALHGLDLDDEQVAANLLLLWRIVDNQEAAERAIVGQPPVATILAVKLRDQAVERLPETWTKQAAAKVLWDARGALEDSRKAATGGGVRTVLFTGHRTKKVIKKVEAQLGVGRAS